MPPTNNRLQARLSAVATLSQKLTRKRPLKPGEEYKQHPKHKELTGLAVLASIALVIQTGLLLLSLFGPSLPYIVSNPRADSLDSDQFLRNLEAITGSQVTRNTRLEVLPNGPNFYPAELAAIRSARRSISMEAYIFRNDEAGRQFLSALAERARAGVAVRLVIDAIGSARLTSGDLKPLTDAGGRFAWYHPLRWYTWPRINNRTHRELLVIDGQVGFIGGAGIARHWLLDTDGQPPWRDTMVRVEGAAVTELQGAFAENWLEAAGEVLTGDAYFPPSREPGQFPALVIRSSPTEGRSTPARILFQTLLASARDSIRITTPYFLPDDSMRDEIAQAIKRGVKVQIIVPGKSSDHLLTRTSSRRLYGDLLLAGAEIYEYAPTMIHAKALVVDALWSVVGSTNMDPRSFSLNDEVNLAVRDGGLATELEREFTSDLASARRVSYEEWRQRPVWERVTEWFGAIIQRQQ
jgi:cardiolipin synthase